MQSNQTADTVLELLTEHKDAFRVVEVDDMGYWVELVIDELDATVAILEKLRTAGIPTTQISGVVYRAGE
jgi:hypothetical protein